MNLEEPLIVILVTLSFKIVKRCIFRISSYCYYCFPIATDYCDNRIVDSTSTNYFVIPAFGQRQLSLPQLNDEALRVEPVIEEELPFPTSMVFVDNDTLLVTQKNDGDVISII